MATGMLVNALVETFFMTNCANFGELIRTGNLDFALLKPIDTQFLISFEKVDLPTLSQVAYALGLMGWSLWSMNAKGDLAGGIGAGQAAMYVLLVLAAVAFFYSLMLVMSCLSLWFGRNQGIEDFWFYITVFARYPQAIYSGTPLGEIIRFGFSYVIPILLVITVPASVLVRKALEPSWLSAVMVGSALVGLGVSRAVFVWSLRRYRSASS
jgi:ABC-2 type transport system permease protein